LRQDATCFQMNASRAWDMKLGKPRGKKATSPHEERADAAGGRNRIAMTAWGTNMY